jgi:hypothetical protein
MYDDELPEHPADPGDPGPRTCANCDDELPPGGDAQGRPRKWCSDYCRTAGYRTEIELAAMTIGADEAVCGTCWLVHRPGQECP